MADKTVSILMDGELLARVDEVAKRDGVSRSRVVRETLEMALHIRAEIGTPKVKKLDIPVV